MSPTGMLLEDILVSCVRHLFDGVLGCGKTLTLFSSTLSRLDQHLDAITMCGRPTRVEHDENDNYAINVGWGDSALSLGAPASNRSMDDVLYACPQHQTLLLEIETRFGIDIFRYT